MFQQLINHSQDLKRLKEEGYELEVRGGYLLIHQIPYVNANKEIKRGILVTELSRNGNTTLPPSTHVIYFVGEHPCDKQGSRIKAIEHSSSTQNLGDNIIVHHSFSNKPPGGYQDYYKKVVMYTTILSSPAKSIDSKVTEKTFRDRYDTESDTAFKYTDTNSSRANINAVNEKIKGQKIAIVGLGGTGAYILDLVSKAPVEQIHLYDGDDFSQHNAFRSPGACSIKHLENVTSKVNYYENTYSNIHQNILPHHYYITPDNIAELKDIDYVFISIDNDMSRQMIIKNLLKFGVTFFDVGLGVNTVDNSLIGTLRVTTGTKNQSTHLPQRISFVEDGDNDYNTNIQIAELNCLNAVLAVIKWKKLSGFYQDLMEEHHTTYAINVAQLLNEDVRT